MRPLKKKLPKNPFVLKTIIPEPYFCDREEDTKKIVSLIKSGNNVVLTAERRIGKSSLLLHILNKREIRSQYNTLYVDIQNTQSPADFINVLKSSISDPMLSTFPRDFNAKFDKVTREYGGKVLLGQGPVSFSAEYRQQRILQDKNVIDEIFQMMSATRKQNIIVFDEFQQIEHYDENITALLRSKFQMMGNTHLIYSGSSLHLLPAMFVQYNQPFYNSSELYSLKKIPQNIYTSFCQEMFQLGKKHLDIEAASLTYDLFCGTTQQMQQVMNRAFDMTESGEIADESTIKDAIENILMERGDAYETFFSTIKSAEERNLIYSIAQEGIGSKMTSQAMLTKYGLGAPSTVFKRLNKFSTGKRKILNEIAADRYVLTDKYLELWIAQQLGCLEFKYETAKQLHRAIKEAKANKMALPQNNGSDPLVRGGDARSSRA